MTASVFAGRLQFLSVTGFAVAESASALPPCMFSAAPEIHASAANVNAAVQSFLLFIIFLQNQIFYFLKVSPLAAYFSKHAFPP